MILSQQDLEALSGQVLGLDPFVVLGLATVGCAAAGWLIGPVLGGTVFGFWYRRFGAQVAEVSRGLRKWNRDRQGTTGRVVRRGS